MSENKADGPACGCGGGSCCSGSGKWVVVILALAVVGVLIARNIGQPKVPDVPAAGGTNAAAVQVTQSNAVAPVAGEQGKVLPRLVDLGAGKCIPCKMMAPILEDLKTTYAGRLEVVFIDVWQNPDAGKKYGINLIPTQIFYGVDGKELFRHEGFFGKEDILAKWKEFGLDLSEDEKSTPK